MVVVVIEPGLERFGAFGVGGVDALVGPFSLEGPVEPFDFAVLPGAVGPDGGVVGSDCGEGSSEGAAFRIGPVVVGHDRLDPVDADRCEERGGTVEEPSGGGALFVAVDL